MKQIKNGMALRCFFSVSFLARVRMEHELLLAEDRLNRSRLDSVHLDYGAVHHLTFEETVEYIRMLKDAHVLGILAHGSLQCSRVER